jgi:hypothetical protein
MRKLLITAVAALLVVPAAGSLAASRDDRTGAELHRVALTAFLHHSRSGPPMLYFAGGMSFDLLDDVAFVGRGPCHREERRGRKVWACRASGRGTSVLPPDYYMDPLLQTAHLEVRRGGFDHVVDWTGKGEPDVHYGGGLGDAVVYAYNNATATGRLFGDRFSTKRADHAMSLLGEFVFATVETNGLQVRMDDEGRVHVDAAFPE